MGFAHYSIQLRFSCSRAFLSAPHDKTLLLAYISRCLSTSHAPFYQFLSAKCFFPGFSTQEKRLCLRENLPFISGDKKMKRGFSTVSFHLFFVFFLYASLLSAPLYILFIQLGPPCLYFVLRVRGLGEHGWLNALGVG